MNILFIGNSYTYYNDMPALLRELAEENGKSVRVDAVTKGGRKLYENLTEGDEYHDKLVALLSERSYDVLILQEQSWLGLVDYEKFEYGVTELTRLVSAKRTVLYVTWGRKKGAPLLTQYGWTTDEMAGLLENAYRRAAEVCGAELSPVGRAFLRVSEALPDLDLYNPDLTHPSYAGSCVAALTHYARIFGALPKSTSSLKLDGEILGTVAAAIESVVG